MGSRKKQLYNYRIIACLLIALFTFPGWKFSSGSDNCGPISTISKDFSFNGCFGSSIYSTDYETDNNKIYIGFSTYFYGESRLGQGIDNVYTSSAVRSISRNLNNAELINLPISGSVSESIESLYKNWGNALEGVGSSKKQVVGENRLNLKPATTVKFVIKVTRFVKLSATKKNGKKSYNITKGKLTQGLCSVKVDNTNISRNLYYYKLETDEGTVTKKWFC